MTSISARYTTPREIIGMSVTYATEPDCTKLEAKHIGTYHPVPVFWDRGKPWDDARVSTDLPSGFRLDAPHYSNPSFDRAFLIDGPGGEVVNAVAVGCNACSIELSTNRGRSEIFGVTKRRVSEYGWRRYAAKEGEFIMGLAICFGEPRGYSEEAEMFSYWGIKHVCVVVQRVEDSSE
jgi:hypothetical protein